jgi:lipoprotein NlpI
MASVTYERVIRLAEQLTPQEQEALVAHLQQLAQQRQLTKQERKALFASMIVDLGPVSPDFSFRR